MKTLRNTKIFNKLLKAETDKQVWEMLFEIMGDYEIPTFFGGLDHVNVKKKGVYFHDIGCNGNDNSFVIRPEL